MVSVIMMRSMRDISQTKTIMKMTINKFKPQKCLLDKSSPKELQLLLPPLDQELEPNGLNCQTAHQERSQKDNLLLIMILLMHQKLHAPQEELLLEHYHMRQNQQLPTETQKILIHQIFMTQYTQQVP